MINITYNKEEQIFHLENDSISYIIGVLPNGHLSHLYYGEKVHGPLSEDLFIRRQSKALTNYVSMKDKHSLNLEPCEYPNFGTSDTRTPAFMLENEDGSIVNDFKYVSHNIYTGKNNLNDLPHTFSMPNKAMSIDLVLIDSLFDLEMVHTYTVFDDYNVIVKSVKLINHESCPVKVNKIMSMSMDISKDYDSWLQLSGDWGRERHIVERRLDYGTTLIDSKIGSSGAINNPGVILKNENTTEDYGNTLGINFVYSGNFEISALRDQNDMLRVMCGINSFGFEWTLEENEMFQTPEVVLAYSSNGMNELSQTFHHFYLNHLINPKWTKKERPILINNWEATYFDFNHEKIMGLAKKAKEIDVNLFVLDDGWFGKRNDDTTSLGDWFVNEEKLVQGLPKLAEDINVLGMDFGIWIEPEMVNENSRLFTTHQEYVIQVPNRLKTTGRNQMVLDFSKSEVVDHIYNQLIAVFDLLPLSYVKWDMNRTITEPYSLGLNKDRQGEFFHSYILGVYRLYKKLINRYPNIMFESCSAGGNRFDAGLLYFAPQGWTSDDTDAVERLKIQHGTSLFYPISSMGSHISAVPNHQTYRVTPLEFRSHVAMFGTFGYEIDLLKLDKEELSLLKEQTQIFAKYQELIHTGNFYRVKSPFKDKETTWSVVSKNKKEALIGHFVPMITPNQGTLNIKFKGLIKEQIYKVESELFTGNLSGSFLMNQGISYAPSNNGVEVIREKTGDYQSYLLYVKAI